MELKSTMLGTELTIRIETVECVYQEIWGALIAYNLIRIGMTRIARQYSLDPQRLSFIPFMRCSSPFSEYRPSTRPTTLRQR